MSAPGFQKSLFEEPVVLSIGTPSMTIRGWFEPESELLPRRTILDEDPGPLDPLMI